MILKDLSFPELDLGLCLSHNTAQKAMPANNNVPARWNQDVRDSVDMYNRWFLEFAPQTYRNMRSTVTANVLHALTITNYMRAVTPQILRENPAILPTLRQSMCPPIARDRLIGLSNAPQQLVRAMENEEHPRIPPRLSAASVDNGLLKICNVLNHLVDKDIFFWLETNQPSTDTDHFRASTIVADRLCGTVSDPIIRNEQERRQLKVLSQWLLAHGYRELGDNERCPFNEMPPGTFAFRHNVPVQSSDSNVNIPVDAIIMPIHPQSQFPLLVEAKSAGDYTNVNKRRKEEAQKMKQLRDTYGSSISFVLLLCGYFDAGYLGYEAAEGIDWVWEHRMDDFTLLGL